MKKILIIILFLLIGINLYCYDWPVKIFTHQHGINATLGEYRPNHFHNGVDINADDSIPVYSVVTDTVLRYDASEPKNSGILTKDSVYWYIHLDSMAKNKSYIHAYTDSIGIIYANQGHLHFREGLNGAHPIINPLRSGGLDPYVDSTNPHIDSIKYYLQCSGDTLLHKDSLNRKVDIVSIAGDTRTDAVGHSPSDTGNVSVYRIGYLVRNMKDTLVKPYWEKVKFDSIPSNSYFGLVYADSSSMTHFRYYITNDIFNSNANLKNMYWNTKQKAGAVDSIDADSIEEAKFKDGYYKVLVRAYDIVGNKDTLIDTVHIDNFMPRVKKSFPLKDTTYSVVADRSTKLYLQFSEEMDTATLKTSNIHINSLVDSYIYDIDSLSYYKDSSYLYIYMDTTFRLQDTVKLKLDTTITDLSGKPIKDSINEYEIDFIVGVKQITDNSIDDGFASIYGDKIVWVQGNCDTISHYTFTGDIMEYDIKTGQTQVISDTNYNLFTRPYIYKDKVAYFYSGYYWTNAVLYYDGAGNTSIISHSSETRAGYSLQVGDSGIVWRGACPSEYTDTTFVFFYGYSDMTTHLLSEEIGNGQAYGTIYIGKVSIDGNEIAYDQFPLDSICIWKNIFMYDIGSGGETQLTHYDPDKIMTYANPIISNGQIVFKGNWGPVSSTTDSSMIYIYDGLDILTVEGVDDRDYAFEFPSLHRGHITYIYWGNPGKSLQTNGYVTYKSNRMYDNKLKRQNSYGNHLSTSMGLGTSKIKNVEFNNEMYKTRSPGMNYLKYFDGKQIITIDQDTLYDYPYLHSYRDIGTAYGYTFYIEGYCPFAGNTVYLVDESGGNIRKREIWYDHYQDNKPVTGYRPTYKGNFVFSAYDGNDYELYLYMGDTTNCVPAVPEGIHYTTTTKTNEVQLFWNKAEDAELYRIYKSASSQNYGTYYAETSDTLYTDADIISNTMYYKISSMRGNNESGLSKQITINDFDTIGPVAPESLRITNIDTIVMNLSLAWNKSLSSDVEKYLIYKKTGIYDVFHLYDSTENNITVYNDTDVQFEINYFYRINGRDYKGNEGAYSNEIDTIIAHSSGISLKKAKLFSIKYSTIQSNGVFLFKLTNGIGKRIDARIYDLSGRTIYKKIITPSNANVIERANIKKNGIYFIEFKYNKNRYVKKIVIL